jgi:thiol-disulfide isomerase/thioredoxin
MYKKSGNHFPFKGTTMRYRLTRPLSRLLVLIQLLLFAGCLHAAEARVGDTPSLPALTTLDGKTIHPDSLRGKVVVFSYFSSTCPFCMNEAPKLQKLYRENADKLIVIGVNVEHQDPEQKIKAAKWVEKYRLTYPVTTDFVLLERALGKPKGLPVNQIFDRKGKLARIDIGEILDEDFDDIARFAQQN